MKESMSVEGKSEAKHNHCATESSAKAWESSGTHIHSSLIFLQLALLYQALISAGK